MEATHVMCVLKREDDLHGWNSAMVTAQAQESHPEWSDTESELDYRNFCAPS